MTTNITIDAHAGWDIEVTIETVDAVPAGLERSGPATKSETKTVVPAGIVQTFAIWEGREIKRIRELKK